MGFPAPYVLSPRVTAASLGVGVTLGGKLIGANMNSTADQAMAIVSPTPTYNIFRIIVVNPSIPLTAAQGSLYLGPGKTGIINATTTAYSLLVSGIETANSVISLSIANTYLTDNTTIYLSLTIAQGAPATADFYVYILPL